MFVSKVTVSSLDNKHSGERLGLTSTVELLWSVSGAMTFRGRQR